MPRHLDEELILEILGDLGVLQAMLVCHCLQQRDLLLVVRVKLALVLVEEVSRLTEELLEDHVQVQADEDGKENAHQLRLKLVQTLVNEILELGEALKVVVWIASRVHILILGGLRGVLTLTKQSLIIFHEGL